MGALGSVLASGDDTHSVLDFPKAACSPKESFLLTDLEAKCKFAKQNVSKSCSNSLHCRRWPAIPADSVLTSAESPIEAGSLVREVGSAAILYVKVFFFIFTWLLWLMWKTKPETKESLGNETESCSTTPLQMFEIPKCLTMFFMLPEDVYSALY